MRTPPFPTGALGTMALLCGLAACDGSGGTPSPAPSATAAASSLATGKDVVATVNGIPIREAELRLVMAKDSHGAPAGPERAKAVLETLVRRELIRQAAVAAGLDAEPRYQEKLRAMEAQLAEFKREALGELYFSRQVAAGSQVSEAEARAYFDDNAAKMKTELHVEQILVKGDEAKIDALRAEIAGGAPFEEVAARQLPAMPQGERKPWDLGYLKWPQLPQPWRPVLEGMKDGEVSPVIAGPNKRFWILRLVERRANESVTFDEVKAGLMESLKGTKVAERRQQADAELRAKAEVVILRDPATVELSPPREREQ